MMIIAMVALFVLVEVSAVPSPSSPFVLYHIAKSGGSTLRDIIYKASMREGLTHMIPCYGKTNCLCQDNYVKTWNTILCGAFLFLILIMMADNRSLS